VVKKAVTGSRSDEPTAVVPTAVVEELSGRSLLTGGIWVMASRALPQIYVLVSSVLIARFLTVGDMGRQSYISFVQLSLILVCSFGFSGALIRYGGELLGQGRLSTLRGLIWWTTKIQIGGAVVTFVIMGGIGLFGHSLKAAWMWAAVGTAFSTFQNVPNGVLSVLRRWREGSIITLAIGFAFTVGIAVELALGGGVAGVFAVGAVLSVIATVWTTWIAQKYLHSVAPVSEPIPELYRPMITYAITIWAGYLLTLVVLRRSEFFFLERYSTADAIAYYSVAFAVVAGLSSAVESIGSMVSPTVAALHGAGDSGRISSGFSRALRFAILAAVPISAFGIVFGPAVIRVVYGSAYTRTAGPLRIMLLAFPVITLMSLCNGLLWGVGRVRFWLGAFCVAAVIDVALDFLLVPAHAEVGAAWANNAAQLFGSALVVGYTIKKFGPFEWHAVVLARAVLAACLAAASGWVCIILVSGAAGIALGAAVALVVFVALSRALRTIPAVDAAWILDSVHGRFARAVANTIGRAAATDVATGAVAVPTPDVQYVEH
jgi:O-antigen/teichoic acid export membrane protein